MFGRIGRWLAPLFHHHTTRPSTPAATTTTTPDPVSGSTPVRAHNGESGFDPAPVTTTPATPSAPATAEQMKINYKLDDATPAQRQKVEQAVALLGQVINDPRFRDAVAAHAPYSQNLGLSSKEILDKVVSGSEDLHPEVDHEIDLTLTVATLKKGTVARTSPSIDQVTLNQRWLDDPNYGVADLANTLMHEWVHKIGFWDSKSFGRADRAAATYEIGGLVEEYAGKLPEA